MALRAVPAIVGVEKILLIKESLEEIQVVLARKELGISRIVKIKLLHNPKY
jgi:hypothetical protein